MSNSRILLKYSLKPKITSKKAILGLGGLFTFALVIVIALGFLADSFVSDSENPLANLIADQILIYPENDISTLILATMPDSELVSSSKLSDEQIESKDDILLVNTEENTITSNFRLDTLAETTITSMLQNAKNQVAISQIPEQYQKQITSSQLAPEFIYTGDESENSGFLYGVNFVTTLVIYFIIIFGIQLLGSEIFEEKSSRAMEIIITNTKPTTHMVVKIISTLIFLLSIILSVVLGVLAGVIVLYFALPQTIGELVDLLLNYLHDFNIVLNAEFFVFLIFVLISSFLAILLFQILAAVTAAMTTSYEDYQKANGPVIIFLLVPYMISMIGLGSITKVLVFIPFFTPFFAPKLYLGADISLLLFGVIIVIQLITVLILFKLASPIYREGLLNYSTSSFKQILKRASTSSK